MQILIRNIGEAFLVFDCVFDVPLKNDVYVNKFQHSYMIQWKRIGTQYKLTKSHFNMECILGWCCLGSS